MLTVQAAGFVWAVTPTGSLSYTPSVTPNWRSAARLSSPVVTISSCDGDATVYAACVDGSMHIFNATSGHLILTSPDSQHEQPTCMLPLPHDDALFVGLRDGSLFRLHLTTLQFDCMLGCGVEHQDAVRALEIDDQYLYSGGDDAVILVWDPKQGNAVREISMPTAPISSLLRVDSALWVGLKTGAVEVYDIFGEDTNGMECVAERKPHSDPVTKLLRVGEAEIWSVAPRNGMLSSEEDISNTAIWDTRDFSVRISDEISKPDLMSLTVVTRDAFEEVSILALTHTLEQQLISTKVQGVLPAYGAGNQEDMEELVSDLEHQLIQANEEINRLRMSGPQPAASLLSPQVSLAGPSSSPRQYQGSSHTNCTGNCAHQLCPARLRKEYYDFSPDEDAADNNPGQIPTPASESITSSLNELSQLLVSLLADDVLAPHEAMKGSNEQLRTAIAKITRELNVSKSLIEQGTTHPKQNGSRHDFNEASYTQSRNFRLPRSQAMERSESQVTPGSDVLKMTQMKKDLLTVSRERDVLCSDLEDLRKDTETTMSALENIIRDHSSLLAEKEKQICSLQEDHSKLKDELVQERALGTELKDSLEQQLDGLTEAADATSKTFEEQLASAYDKVETKEIEVNARNDMLRTNKLRLEELRTANEGLESKVVSLEEELAVGVANTDTMAKEFAARAIDMDKEYQSKITETEEMHRSELSALRAAKDSLEEQLKKSIHSYEETRDLEVQAKERNETLQSEFTASKAGHAHEVASLRESNADLQEQLQFLQEESRKQTHSYFLDLQAVKDERDQRVDDLNHSGRARDEMETQLHAKLASLETELREEKIRFNSKKAEWDRVQQEIRERVAVESRKTKEKYEQEVQRRDSRVEELRDKFAEAVSAKEIHSTLEESLKSELNAMKQERSLLTQEVFHREAAEKLFEAEAGSLQSAIADLKLANDELQHLLEEREKESEQFQETLKRLTADLELRDVQLRELEACPVVPGDGHEAFSAGSDTQKATQAILASATGEVEQLSKQIDAMNRAHSSQERELNELREGLCVRDGMLRLKNSLIENLTHGKIAIEDLSSPGVPMNLSPAGLPSSTQESDIRPTPDLHAGLANNEENVVRETLEEIHSGMNLTHSKLKALTDTTRKYKKLAQCHVDILPALHEVEVELARVAITEPQKGSVLTAAQGIVQSLIAQYYSSGQKQALLKEYDETLYNPSEKRLTALHEAISRLRKLRTGSEQIVFQQIDDIPDEKSTPLPQKQVIPLEGTVLSTKRLLTFNS